MKHIHAGKVRDLYEDGESLILVASDRVSVFDVVLPTPIPEKGAMLTQLSNWWFDFFGDVPNHILSTTDVPAEFAGRGVRVKPLKMLKVECVARGYLTGGGLAEYKRSGTVSGIALPPGLRDGDKLPEPLFTPSTKADEGHDEPISFADVVNQEGREVAEQLRDLTLGIYSRGAEHAAGRGVIIADTKVEFGWDGDVLTLGDEVLTSDSSRFWPADDYEPGRPQASFDKQYVRDWSVSTGWNKEYPGPDVPADVIDVTRQKYMQAYELITGNPWTGISL